MRKTIAALLLALGLSSPALAAPCGPIPALPDTERRTEYSGVSSSTGPFNVNFQLYGDSTDYGNWLAVWVNGVLKTAVTDYTVATASGPALGSACLPIVNAQVTFLAPQTGTIEIVGARRPRRASQFGVQPTINAFNQVISDLTAMQRERWDAVGRLLRAPPGDTLTVLPPAATRASTILGFDGAGNPSLVAPTIGLGNVLGPASSVNNDLACFNGTTGTLLKDCGNAIRIKLTADTTLQANSSTGNDANPCTVALPCLTGQHLYDVATLNYDRAGFQLTLQVVGTFTPGNGVTFMSMLGAQAGNARQGTQGAGLFVNIAAATLNLQNANAFACDQFCAVNVVGAGTINLNGGTSNQGNAIIADNGGFITLNGATVAGAGNCVAQTNSVAQVALTNITVSGTYKSLVCLNIGSSGATTGTITNSGTPTFTDTYIALNGASLLMDGTTIVGAITGSQYFMRGASTLSIGGVSLPGTAGINQGGWVGLNALPPTAGGTGAALLVLTWSATAPTVSAGFCTSPSIAHPNGTAAFEINIGSACAGSTGTIAMPTATNGWVCDFRNVTAPASNTPSQTGGANNTVTVTNYVRTTGVAGNFTASDVLRAKCVGY